MSNVEILGVKINLTGKTEALEMARNFLNSPKQNTIFTPNPEMLVETSRDPAFKAVLNKGDLNICDGFGIKLIAPRINRIPGVDFMLDLCAVAEHERASVYLLGSENKETVESVARILWQKFSALKIAGADPGSIIELVKGKQGSELRYNQDAQAEILHRIILAAPDILFVAFGHNKQEKWIAQNIQQLPSVKIAMGVGGSFDYISGKIKRAPKFVQAIGLEWLWRLIREPRRIKRIWNATVVFMWKILVNRVII